MQNWQNFWNNAMQRRRYLRTKHKEDAPQCQNCGTESDEVKEVKEVYMPDPLNPYKWVKTSITILRK